MNNAPALVASGICKSYSSPTGMLEVLKDIRFTVAKNDFVAIRGGSGSGKSTLLNIIGGLDSADEGEVMIAGSAITRMANAELTGLRRKSIGFVFQRSNLIPGL